MSQLVEAGANFAAMGVADMALFGADIRRAAMDGAQQGASNFAGSMAETLISSLLPAKMNSFSNMIATAGIYTIADQYLQNSPFEHPIAKFFYSAGVNGIANTFVAPMIDGV